jgi:hypothetical protein
MGFLLPTMGKHCSEAVEEELSLKGSVVNVSIRSGGDPGACLVDLD